MLLHDRG
jgi:hypothetical protein